MSSSSRFPHRRSAEGLLVLRFIVLVLKPGVSLRWILAECRHALPLSIWRLHALVMGPGICLRFTFYIQHGGKSHPFLSVVVNFKVVQFKVSKNALGVGLQSNTGQQYLASTSLGGLLDVLASHSDDDFLSRMASSTASSRLRTSGVIFSSFGHRQQSPPWIACWRISLVLPRPWRCAVYLCDYRLISFLVCGGSR